MLGPEEYGEFGALMALFLIAGLPATALGSAITKFTSRHYAENNYREIAQLRKKIQNNVLIFSSVLFLLIVLFSNLIAGFLKISSGIPVIIVGAMLVLGFILPMNRGVLQGMKKFTVLSWNNIIEAFSRLLLLIIFLYFEYGVNGALFAYGLAYFIAYLFVFPFIKETKGAYNSTEKSELKPVYRFILQVLMVNLLLQTLINLPSIFIKHYYSSEFTGYWTAALNIARISLFISGAISAVMFPEITGEKNHQLKKKIFERAAILVLLASSGMAVIFFSIPKLLINTLYGTSYLGAIPMLEWMGVAMVFIGLLQLRADYFLAKL